MLRRPPRSTRTDTLFPDTTLVRSGRLPCLESRFRPPALLGRNGVYHAGQTAVHRLFLGLVVRGVDPAAGFAGWPAELELAEHVDYFDVLPPRLPSVRTLPIICRGHLPSEWVLDLSRGLRSEERLVGKEFVSKC